MIDGRNFFNQPTESELINLQKKTDTGQDHDYSTGYLLNYLYFKESFISISIDLSEQQVFDASPKASQLINVTSNLYREENASVF